jgi:hypothetical protein
MVIKISTSSLAKPSKFTQSVIFGLEIYHHLATLLPFARFFPGLTFAQSALDECDRNERGHQGEQIGRIFAHRAMFIFGGFFN